jgi:uncharacterized protein (DUF427 family)
VTRSDRTTCCPYKGAAAYFGISVGGERSIDAVSVGQPIPETSANPNTMF